MYLKRIYELRKEKGLTPLQVSESIDVPVHTYSNFELGKINIPIKILIKLSDLYEVNIDYITDRVDERAPYPPRMK